MICQYKDYMIFTHAALNDPVNVLTAFHLTKPYSNQWEDIGRSLGLSRSDRRIIREEEESADNRLEAMLEKWIETSQEIPRWRMLIAAVRGTGLVDLADSMQSKYQSA